MTIKAGIFGLGRMGRIHLDNLCNHIQGVEVVAAVTPSEEGQQYAWQLGVPYISAHPDVVFDNPEIDTVIIASPSDTHADLVMKGIAAGKAVFCEKPLDLSRERVVEIIALAEMHKAPLMVAFNQRFDRSFSKVKESIDAGRLGELRTIKITSRDPTPPPISYIEQSGGLFLDMTIHDFDMARYMACSEVAEVYAKGHNLVDPAIGKAGDIDTAMVMLTFENQVTAVIENSRQAAYGYDQRLEVFGSEGMAQADNHLRDTHILSDKSGGHSARPMDFFMDRYRDSYRYEMEAFIRAMTEKQPPPVSGQDGLKAMLIALAANKSLEENRPVHISEIEAT